MDVNRMSFNPEKYKNEAEMWKDITSFMQTLLKNEYVMVVREEDFGIITIEYGYDERRDCYGVANPYWISQDEYINILETRDGDEEVLEVNNAQFEKKPAENKVENTYVGGDDDTLFSSNFLKRGRWE